MAKQKKVRKVKQSSAKVAISVKAVDNSVKVTDYQEPLIEVPRVAEAVPVIKEISPTSVGALSYLALALIFGTCFAFSSQSVNIRQAASVDHPMLFKAEVPAPVVENKVAEDSSTNVTPSLQVSKDLHYVIPFAPGRYTLGPVGKEKVKEAVDMAGKAGKVVVDGYSGTRKTAAKRHKQALGRAVAVKRELAKNGVDKAKIKLRDPNLSIKSLKNEGDDPRAVITLLD